METRMQLSHNVKSRWVLPAIMAATISQHVLVTVLPGVMAETISQPETTLTKLHFFSLVNVLVCVQLNTGYGLSVFVFLPASATHFTNLTTWNNNCATWNHECATISHPEIMSVQPGIIGATVSQSGIMTVKRGLRDAIISQPEITTVQHGIMAANISPGNMIAQPQVILSLLHR